MDNSDNLDASSDIKLEETSNSEMSTLSGNKRKLEVKSEPYSLQNISDDLSIQPKAKKMRLDDNSIPSIESVPKITVITGSTSPQENDSNTFNNLRVSPPQSNPPTPQYFMPPMAPTNQYFLPVVPPHLAPHPYSHHISAFHPHINMNINPSYIHHHHPHPHYNGYHTYRNQPINNHNLNNNKNESIIKTNNNKRKRKKIKPEDSNTDNSSELLTDDNDNNNSKLATDKSPFKTTYISPEEETQLKNTNNALYSQFHHARQAIYQQYKNKIEQIRISNILTQPKRKLQIKIAAIDAKVQEKKLFLSYLEMSKPQSNSWLISNSTHPMNAFTRKINTPNAYTNISEQQQNNNNENNNNKCEEKKEISQDTQAPKKPMSAKRVKKPKFSEYNVRVLRDWYETHTSNPYPSSSEKHLMCQLTGLTKYQVSRWFCNVRTRKPPPELSDNDEDIINIDKNNIATTTHPHITTTHRQLSNNDYYPMHYHPRHHPIHLPPPPPITPIPITPNHHTHFNFTPMNINNINIPIINNNQMKQLQQQQNENNMIDNNIDNSEGLMPTINSNFYDNNTQNNCNSNNNNTDLMPPPLIDENSNHQT